MTEAPFGLGGVPRTKDPRDFDLGAYQPPVPIPTTFMQDWSQLPVYMQGTFGTCGAHGGAFVDSVLQTIKRGSPQPLAPKYLWKQIKLIDGIPLEEGTTLTAVLKSLTNTGDCHETLCPNILDATIEEYSNPATLTPAMKSDAYQNDIENYAFIDNPTWYQIRQAIYQNKVVAALVDCGDGWWTPSWKESDILPLKLGNKVGGHFVALHSYDEQYIYFRNSWSSAWGRNGDGYFDISYLPHIHELGTAIALPATYIFTTDLLPGQTSNDVLQLQKRLGVQPQTGFYGTITTQAVIAYQKAHNITPTGNVGPITRAALNTSTN
jgi:Putative peptidoglycan binding domain